MAVLRSGSHTGANPAPRSQAIPLAQRLTARRWAQPRIVIGVVLVAVSVVLGARIVAAMDDTIEVWALKVDAPAGSVVGAGDVQIARVHFDDDALAARYLSADEAVPADTIVAHDLVAGDLLARSALTAEQPARAGELPIAVPLGSVPPGLRAGQVVDVWVAPDSLGGADAATATARKVLSGVSVLDIDDGASAAAGGAAVKVLVGLSKDQEASLGQPLAALVNGSVVLVRVPATTGP